MHNIGVDRKHHGTGFGQAQDALPLAAHKRRVLAAPFGAAVVFAAGLVQFGIGVPQRVEPPQRAAHLHPIKQPLHAPRHLIGIAVHRRVNAHQGAHEFFVQRPAGRKTQNRRCQNVLVALFLQNAKVILHQPPKAGQGRGRVYRHMAPIGALHISRALDKPWLMRDIQQHHVQQLLRGVQGGRGHRQHLRALPGQQRIAAGHLACIGLVDVQPIGQIKGLHPRQWAWHQRVIGNRALQNHGETLSPCPKRTNGFFKSTPLWSQMRLAIGRKQSRPLHASTAGCP